ncbi:MAG: molybdopterin converting factor subunit 1 [Fulvivirga sp.]|nr:molybdopterin converting factor subunit 1 [Fulvivirga sp.]
MKIDILLFGITKDIIGGESREVELPEGATVKELKQRLMEDFPELKKLRSVMVAVNNEYGKDNQSIDRKDEIALIPPVSGG